MTDATTMTQHERDKLTRELEQLVKRGTKPHGLVSEIADERRNRPLTIAEINAMAAERGLSYGQMVLELERRR